MTHFNDLCMSATRAELALLDTINILILFLLTLDFDSVPFCSCMWKIRILWRRSDFVWARQSNSASWRRVLFLPFGIGLRTVRAHVRCGFTGHAEDFDSPEAPQARSPRSICRFLTWLDYLPTVSISTVSWMSHLHALVFILNFQICSIFQDSHS